jgi:hypothetical protein
VTNATWSVGNRQIHEDLGILFFADHIRALTENFESKLAGVATSWSGSLEGTYVD